MPVFLKVEFEDKTTKEVELPVYVWYYTNLWTTDVPTEGKSVSKVTLDPRRNIPDSDRSNNWSHLKGDGDSAKPEEKSSEGEKPQATGGDGDDGQEDDYRTEVRILKHS
jgi:hypothetical protein